MSYTRSYRNYHRRKSAKMNYRVAIFTLNQWALDFSGNTDRIIQTINYADTHDAIYRAGPELEVCGYSLEDAFFEQDTVYHSWRSLVKIAAHSRDINLVVDIGMPVFNVSLYNCRVIIYRGRILCIRAKTKLAREGIYRECRHFAAWDPKAPVAAYRLPDFVCKALEQAPYVPFGSNFTLELAPVGRQSDPLKIGWEICQELWESKNVSAELYQDFGCHLVVNGSGSYWELRKLNTVLDMVRGISLRGGGCYAFSNLVGCDGQRYVFSGRSCIFDRGSLVAMAATDHNIFNPIQTIFHDIDTRAIHEYRNQMGIKPAQSSKARTWDLSKHWTSVSEIGGTHYHFVLVTDPLESAPIEDPEPPPPILMKFEEEIHMYVSLWLWDYLRRSKMIGFMLPLSGGLDSCSVATLIYGMCTYLFENRNFVKDVGSYFNSVHKVDVSKLKGPNEFCKIILRCCYLSTQYSSEATLRRARELSRSIGAEFVDLSIQDVYQSFRGLLNKGLQPDEVSLLDQNLQARLRMAATYYLSAGNRIVLATGNVDEGIMGYLTKYDCSSADINPIGGLCKSDLKSYLKYCCDNLYSGNEPLVAALREIIDAPPSAELTGAEQRDEDEIGITYDEISVLGKVRRGIYACSGPRGAFETVWSRRFEEPFRSKIRCLREMDIHDKASVERAINELAELIKRFFQRYAKNRHKLTVLTPALHAETYSPDDNRFDHRHFLYAPWLDQFKSIDKLAAQLKKDIKF